MSRRNGLGETYGHGGKVTGSGVFSERPQACGISAAAQEQNYRHIGDQMLSCGIQQNVAKLLSEFAFVHYVVQQHFFDSKVQ